MEFGLSQPDGALGTTRSVVKIRAQHAFPADHVTHTREVKEEERKTFHGR